MVCKRILESHPLALYLHCSSHSLNLAISDACALAAVRNCMGTVGNVYNFFNTPKRQTVLQRSIHEVAPDSSATRLKQLCPTRWVERHDSIILFLELYEAVIDALEIISGWTDRDTASSANQLMCAIKQAEFVVTLHIVAKVFGISLPLSRFLQTENTDLAEAMLLAAVVENAISDIRTDVDQEFHVIYAKVERKCANLGIELVLPRITKRQTHRFNVAADSPEEYFRVSICIPFLDSFISQLHERLLAHKTVLRSFRCLFPEPQTLTSTGITESEHLEYEDNIVEIIRSYASDINCGEQIAIEELRLWRRQLTSVKEPPTTGIDSFNACNGIIYPTVKKLLKIFVTLPVTTSTSERSFSTLRRLKTYLRNTTSESRLNGLAVLNIHRDIALSSDNILNELANKPRRLNFILS